MAIGSPRKPLAQFGDRATSSLSRAASGPDFARFIEAKGDAHRMDNSKVISTLNGLIETLKDGEQGFKTAAEGLNDTQVKTMFQQYSRQRGEMARELQGEVRRLGGDPEKSGSVSGAAHRGWMNIK